MAIVRKITDGTTTVDFNDGSTLHLARPFDLGVGSEGGDVTTVIRCLWDSSVSQDNRAATRQSIQLLLNKGRDRRKFRRAEDWVWLEVRSENENLTRYAVVKGGLVASPTSNEEDDKQDFLRVSITREAEWRDATPDGAGQAAVSAVTIYNKSDADGDNWVTVSDSGRGDAPSITKIINEVSNNGIDTLIVGAKYGSTTHLDGFNPWFNPTDLANNGGGTQTADPLAPADFTLVTMTSGEPYWQISAANLDHYHGNYRAYVYAKGAGLGSATIGIEHGSQTAPLTTVDIPTTHLLHDLGPVTLPDFPIVFSNLPTTGNYQVRLDIDVTGVYTVTIYGLILVPLEESFFVTSPEGITGSNTQWTIDGFTQNTYLANSSGDQLLGFPLVPSGRHPQIRMANDDNIRFYFFADNGSTTPYFNDTMQITVRVKDGHLTSIGTG